ncbi:hypothetical protein Tco_0286027 [Tanacetum coccineum]
MASLDHRLNPLFSIKECMSCGVLYTRNCGCLKGSLEDKILVPKPPKNCATCGNPVDGLNCRSCAFVRKCLNEGWYTIHDENEILNTSKSSNHNINVVSAPQEPFVFNQDPGVNSLQSPLQSNHNCCYKCGDSLDDIFCQRCTCKSCGNGAHIGYNFPPKASIISNPEQCNQTIDELSQTLPSVHPTCDSGDENSFTYDSKPNSVNDSPNIFNPSPMYSCEFCRTDASYGHYCEEIDDEYERDSEIKINQLLQDYSGLDIEMRKKERVLREEKYLAVSQRIKSICYDEDDSIPLRDIIARYSPSVAITSSPPVLPTEEPEDSLIMGDEHLDTIPEKESDEVIKSSVENLVPIPSEFEDFSDNESECDVPECDETSPTFTTFSNPLFDSNDDFTSSDDESLSDEDVPMENFKIYSNPLFVDEEIISTKIDPHFFNAESNLIESLLNQDTVMDSSPKFDYLLEEFSGELAHIDPIPSGIEKADFDLEEEIRLVENLLYDNSSPRPPEELNLEIADTILESLSPSLIPVTDSDSLMEEINYVEISLIIETDTPMINNVDELNEDECFDPGEMLCTEFEKLMHKKFQMSSMGGLTFFLGLQVMQKDDGIFISHDKYPSVFHSRLSTLRLDIILSEIPMKEPIQMIKIHTDQNVADLLTKAFDVGNFNI